ncbi:uncharacterized protein MELLADRAFT_64276 [Melampsora larici-populina 98AG31]|uniref:3-keto sterol reductase n=1 Tax=Melampsora larici-populina (strain 98AG31 / pathotype 3-4-7) TaxID=747676 RepID=F4RQU8_MELLP|nr:uncharacterized protein MELLADRAFT_64276 [Melampsora larici-populina 98AG31]EGG05263.1 hypothetical protein MELLADRAFT_64276 [Melampsora larici-populina 98AG31]
MAVDESARFPPAPVMLLTGANGAVGFGICLRILYQLSQPTQSDISLLNLFNHSNENHQLRSLSLQSSSEEEDFQSVYATPNGLTLLLGCRNRQKAQDARDELLKKLNRLFKFENQDDRSVTSFSFIDRLTGQVEIISFQTYRQLWLENLKIEFLELDLSNLNSIFKAVDQVKLQYGHLSHLLLNAGGGTFIGLDWIKVFRGMVRNLVEALTYPDYMLESRSEETDDKLGYTWQLNVFGHYLLARLSLPLLARTPSTLPARIIWTGSLDGLAKYFDPQDYQCLESDQAYQSTKYQVGLLGWAFNSVIRKYEADVKKEETKVGTPQTASSPRVVSLVAHPGIVAGNMFTQIVGVFLDYAMLMTFYLVRTFFGSSHHVISAYKAGLVWTFASLGPSTIELGNLIGGEDYPFRMGARCDRIGGEYVVLESNHQTEGYQRWFDDEHANLILDKCDQLYLIHSRKQKIDIDTESA